MLDDFAVFIMVWGRPDQPILTLRNLRKHGYTGPVYLVADDLDPTLEGYQDKYADSLIIFSKREVQDAFDAGDNSGDLRSTMYAANVIPRLAQERGYRYFCIFCDDYTSFQYKLDGEFRYTDTNILDLDEIFSLLLAFYQSIPATSIAIAQGGDFIGGRNNNIFSELGARRKAMNTFLCSTERPFQFLGRMNEDVTTYVNLGSQGHLFLTIPNLAIHQPETQSRPGGLTDLYVTYGTYVKSFFTVMYNPSCTKVGLLRDRFTRIHHNIAWANAVPCILSEQYRKASQQGANV